MGCTATGSGSSPSTASGPNKSATSRPTSVRVKAAVAGTKVARTSSTTMTRWPVRGGWPTPSDPGTRRTASLPVCSAPNHSPSASTSSPRAQSIRPNPDLARADHGHPPNEQGGTHERRHIATPLGSPREHRARIDAVDRGQCSAVLPRSTAIFVSCVLRARRTALLMFCAISAPGARNVPKTRQRPSRRKRKGLCTGKRLERYSPALVTVGSGALGICGALQNGEAQNVPQLELEVINKEAIVIPHIDGDPAPHSTVPVPRYQVGVGHCSPRFCRRGCVGSRARTSSPSAHQRSRSNGSPHPRLGDCAGRKSNHRPSFRAIPTRGRTHPCT
jgi:hypothetical protein